VNQASNTKHFIIGQIESSPKPSLESSKVSSLDISSVATIIAALAAIGTLVVTWRQLSKVAQSLQLQSKAIQANVVLDCSKHYDSIISSIESYREGNKPQKIDLWWYRLWDLYTKEFFFFREGLIDKSIYEVWMIELAYRYDEKPFGYDDMETLRESHKKYLDSRLSASHDDINSFFNQIHAITKNYPGSSVHSRSANDKVTISKEVHKLILEFSSPKNA